MFEDMAIITIWVSQNIAIVVLAIFMWYMSRLSRDEGRQEAVAYEKRADR